jgi:hypothetical protein
MATTKNNKVMHAFVAPSIRKLVEKACELEIPRSDVITIIKERESYVLIYYYGKA